MDKKVTEKLSIYKLYLSFNILAIFGIIGWLFTKFPNADYKFITASIWLIILTITAIRFIITINKKIEKWK